VHSWWLGGRSPSARFDFAPNGARAPTSIDAPIESVKTNADGSRLLVSFGLEPSGSSHVCVYDVANDAWASFDFAAQIGRVAETVAWDCRFPSLFCAQTARLETPAAVVVVLVFVSLEREISSFGLSFGRREPHRREPRGRAFPRGPRPRRRRGVHLLRRATR
jgi:hypothetical protein